MPISDRKAICVLVSIFAAFIAIVSASSVRADSPPLKVELIWAMPDTLTVYLTGDTVFSSTAKTERSIRGWNLADVATDAAQQALTPKFVVTRYEGDVSQFMNVTGGPFDPPFKKTGKLIQQLPNPDHVDLYLVATPSFIPHPMRPENWSLSAYGIYGHKGLLGDFFGEHAAFYLELYDAQTGFRTGYAASCRRYEGSCIWPQISVDGTTWADSADLLTPQQLETMRQDFVWLTREVMTGGLIKMRRASPEALAKPPEPRPAHLIPQK